MLLIESASTFMEVSGVLSSCDTFDTNSCLDSSITRMPESIELKLLQIVFVSVQSFTFSSASPYPAFISAMPSESFLNGLIR